jgi:DNA primase
MNIDKIIQKLGLEKARLKDDELIASCPFAKDTHFGGTDRNPSWALNTIKGVHYCFSCGKRGTLEELTQELLGVQLSDAVRIVQQEFEFDPTMDIIDAWETVEILYQSIITFLPEAILDSYTFIENIGGIEIYEGEEDGKDCWIYPVRNSLGLLIGGIARSKEGRYHDNLWHFEKHRFLLGEHVIVKEAPVVIVEGVGDAIAIKRSGWNNVVSVMGSEISKDQIKRLLNLSSYFIVWSDKDPAGFKMLREAYYRLEPRTVTVKYVDTKTELVDDENDPKDVYENRGAKEVLKIIDNAKTNLVLKMNYCL